MRCPSFITFIVNSCYINNGLGFVDITETDIKWLIGSYLSYNLSDQEIAYKASISDQK